MLTIAAVKAAAPRARAYKIGDGGGLYLYVAPSGLKSWRMKYRFGGREQLLVLGRWPEQPIGQARLARDAARARIAAGDNPAARQARAVAADASFEAVARAWHAHKLPEWSPRHAADVLASLELDVFPAIGDRAPDDIDPPAVLRLLRAVEARGRIEKARRLRQRLSAIFAFAISEGIGASDPSASVGRSLRSRPLINEHPALTEVDQVRRLFADLVQAPAPASVRAAAQLLALTAVRLEAVRGARWDEIEDLDGPTPAWRVPAARMKLKRAKKESAKFDFVVPLSRQATELLRGLRATSTSTYVFPGATKGVVPIGERAIRDLHVAAGYAGRHVPHGWRASFSTIMNRERPSERAAIDLALAHAAKDKVEAAYNREAYLAPRRALLQAWADLIAAS